MNALRNWQSLDPSCETLVFGDEEGIAEACREVRAKYFPGIPRNEYGTPLLDHAFREASRVASNALLCYANSDILFFPDFIQAAKLLKRECPQFLGVGERHNFNADTLDFRGGAEQGGKLRDLIREHGVSDGRHFIDYFLFPKPLFETIPPFAVGRPAWDNWMIYEARRKQTPVVNMTAAVLVGHQNHDYRHTSEGRAGGRETLWKGLEAERNRQLAGRHLFHIADATHQLDEAGTLTGIKRPWYFLSRFREAHEIFPRWRWILLPLWKLINGPRSLDHKIRLFLLRHGIDVFPGKEKRRGARNGNPTARP